MDYNAGALPLKRSRLPKDWDGKYSERMIQGYIDFLWEDWPYFHSCCICQQGNVENLFRENENILDGSPPKELDLGTAYSFFNKTTVLYLAYGGDNEVHWRINEPKFPVYWMKWLQDAYNTWARDCEPRERLDARFGFAMRQFSKQDDRRVQKWIGLGEEPSKSYLNDVEILVSWHIQQCDLIEARAIAHVSTEEAYNMGAWWTSEGVAQRAKAYHSVLAPTCRAILAIGRNPMPATQHVLLVLTGHIQDMVSGAPSFDSIPSKDVIARRSETIVEVSLQTAVRYLRVLERREEYVNAAFRAKNDERREAIYEDIRQKAHNELKSIREFCGQIGGRRTRRGRKRSKRPWDLNIDVDIGVIMEASWKYIVADEHQVAVLSATTELRRNILDKDVGSFSTGTIRACKGWRVTIWDAVWKTFF